MNAKFPVSEIYLYTVGNSQSASSAFGGEGETLILNANHPLVQYITEHQDGENAEMICEQLYDLAKLQHAPLSADAMTKFVARSNDIMMLLTK